VIPIVFSTPLEATTQGIIKKCHVLPKTLDTPVVLTSMAECELETILRRSTRRREGSAMETPLIRKTGKYHKLSNILVTSTIRLAGISLDYGSRGNKDRLPRPRTAPRRPRESSMTTPRGIHPSPMRAQYQPGRKLSIDRAPGPRPQTSLGLREGGGSGMLPFLEKVPYSDKQP
jgi:hypothetical protein